MSQTKSKAKAKKSAGAKAKLSHGYDVSAANLAALSEQLIQMLRIRTIPIGMKLFKDADEMLRIPGVRRPTDGCHFTMCQMVGQCRTAGFTLGIRHENTRMNSNCGGIVGLNRPSDAGPRYWSFARTVPSAGHIRAIRPVSARSKDRRRRRSRGEGRPTFPSFLRSGSGNPLKWRMRTAARGP